MQGSCMYSHPPTLTLIHKHSQFNPKSGPQLGGTEVTITGSNLGAEQSDIQYVRIDGVNCTVIDYQPGVRFAALIHSTYQLKTHVFSLSSSPFLCTHVPPPPPSHPHILPSHPHIISSLASSVGPRQKSAVLSPISSPLSLTTVEVPPFHRDGSLTSV